MKYNLSDLLDTYLDESVDFNGSTPLSPAAIRERTMEKIKLGKRGNAPGKRCIRRSIGRSLLIAAAILSLFCLTAVGIQVSLSLRDAARMDMGISAENPIPEWTEYHEAETTAEEAEEVQVTLMSTMCAEERLYAYIAVSPVPEEIAAILAKEDDPEYEWDLGGISAVGCTFHTEQTGYDPETKTALVKVFVRGEELRQSEQVELVLTLTHHLKPEERFGPIVIPVTQSQTICIPVDIPVQNTRAHFQAAWGLRPEMPDIPDYVVEGRITQIHICAGYMEVEVETPDLSQWIMASHAEQIEIEENPNMPLAPGMEDRTGSFIRSLFRTSWSFSVNEALQGAVIHYKDGTLDVVEEIPRDFAGVWLQPSGTTPDTVYEGQHRYQFTPKQAFDWMEMESIAIGGTRYVLPTIPEEVG